MKKIITIFSLALLTIVVSAQNPIDKVLKDIEANNTSLSALRKSIDSEKIENKTDIYLKNPEVELGYLWGNPSIIGNRTNFSVSQSFQYPTAYKHKKHISGLKNSQLEIEYAENLRSVMLQSKLICIELIHTNAMISNWQIRINNAKIIADSYKLKFEAGETNIMELNKAQLSLLNQGNELKSLEIVKNTLLSELSTLNGGNSIEINESTFQPITITDDFETWYLEVEKNIPSLNWFNMESEINQSQYKLIKASNLPEFQAGYMSEKVASEQFQGVTLGLSIPLWENKNTLKQNKARSLAIDEYKSDNRIKIYNHLKSLYNNTKSIEKNLTDYRLSLSFYDNSSYLKKALDNGEISLIEYMMELSLFYESLDNLLELEKDMNISAAEMNKYL